jgi:hypothetical protein
LFSSSDSQKPATAEAVAGFICSRANEISKRFRWNRTADSWNPCHLRQDRHLLLRALALCAVLLVPVTVQAQARPGSEFQLTKITKNLISAPQYTYIGAQQYQTNQRELWLEVEATFASAPLFTDELTFKYFILLNGKILTGEVTHTNIPAGRENRSVMYVSPHTLARFNNNRPVTVNSVQNIAVQIVQQSAVKDELSLVRAPAQWYASLPPTSYWDHRRNSNEDGLRRYRLL